MPAIFENAMRYLQNNFEYVFLLIKQKKKKKRIEKKKKQWK